MGGYQACCVNRAEGSHNAIPVIINEIEFPYTQPMNDVQVGGGHGLRGARVEGFPNLATVA